VLYQCIQQPSENNSQPSEIPHASNREDQELLHPETNQPPDIAIAIPLSKGKATIISQADGDLTEFSWHYNMTDGYAQRQIERDGKTKHVFLHRIIGERVLNRPLTREDFIEHINGDKLDNRRENILPMTASERSQRRKTSKLKTLGYKGVFYHKNRNNYEARITIHGHRKSLGSYLTPEEAAQAYNEAAHTYYGEKARLNDISG
jgi:AP2 domain